MYLYREGPFNKHVTWEGGREKTNKRNRKWHRKEGVQSKKACLSHKSLDVFFCVIQSFLLGFWWNPDITVNKKKSTSNKEPTSISDIIVSYLYKNIIIPLLCQCWLFVHICASKNSLVFKDAIFYLLWYNVMRWSRNICSWMG